MPKEKLPLKYDIVSLTKVNDILSNNKDNILIDYIKDLLQLIEYQKQLINKQEQFIIAVKHQEAWKHYDRPLNEYDTINRKYADRPPKIDNRSC